MMPTRRSFLRMNLLAAAGLPAATTLLRGNEPRKAPPSERVRLGFVGLGGMGSGTLSAMLGQPDVSVLAVCDVYEPHAGQAIERTKNKAEVYKDFRKVLDRSDIDAVVVSTPDHWHAYISHAALEAGKHVYCEKPLTHTIGAGKKLAAAARKAGKTTQMGIQVRGGENYHRVVDIVRSGVLGKIHKVHVWVSRPRLGIGNPADRAPPEGLDWDFWLGPAPKRPFNPNRFLFHWRWFWDYGGGLLADMGCHVLDLVHWALELDAPTSVAASGGKLHADDNTETPDTMEVIYEYPGFVLTWSHTMLSQLGREKRGLGVQFFGTNGMLVADYGSFELFDTAGKKMEPPKIANPIARTKGHHREWLDAIKGEGVARASFEYGHRLTTVCNLGNLALALGRKLYWDGLSEVFLKDPDANQYLNRPQRAPWQL
jgi:predicted dehydrogenase